MTEKILAHTDILIWVKVDAEFKIGELPNSCLPSIDDGYLCLLACEAGSRTIPGLLERIGAVLSEVPPRLIKLSAPIVSIGLLIPENLAAYSFYLSSKDLAHLANSMVDVKFSIFIATE